MSRKRYNGTRKHFRRTANRVRVIKGNRRGGNTL